jgi:hypothetical protein
MPERFFFEAVRLLAVGRFAFLVFRAFAMMPPVTAFHHLR